MSEVEIIKPTTAELEALRVELGADTVKVLSKISEDSPFEWVACDIGAHAFISNGRGFAEAFSGLREKVASGDSCAVTSLVVKVMEVEEAAGIRVPEAHVAIEALRAKVQAELAERREGAVS